MSCFPLSNWKKSDKQETATLSEAPGALLRQPISTERVSEVASLLRRWGWKRRLNLKHLQKFAGKDPCDYPLAVHIRTLDVYGVEKWQESCFAAWALGATSLKESDKKEVQLTLSEALEGKRTSQKEALSRSLGRVYLRTYALSALFCSLAFVNLYKSIASGALHQDVVMALITAVSVTLFVAIFLSIPLYFPIIAICRAFDYSRNRKIQRFAAQSLGRLGMPTSAGVLASSALNSYGGVARTAYRSLMQVLPAVSAEHLGTPLSGKSVRDLCNLLHRLDFANFSPSTLRTENGDPIRRTSRTQKEAGREQDMLKILEAIEAVGDSSALPVVSRLAERSVFTSVQTRALRLIPILEERRRQENDRNSLLRGSVQPRREASLLRPASSIPVDPSALLRPAMYGRALQNEDEPIELKARSS